MFHVVLRTLLPDSSPGEISKHGICTTSASPRTSFHSTALPLLWPLIRVRLSNMCGPLLALAAAAAALVFHKFSFSVHDTTLPVHSLLDKPFPSPRGTDVNFVWESLLGLHLPLSQSSWKRPGASSKPVLSASIGGRLGTLPLAICSITDMIGRPGRQFQGF